MWVNDVSVGIIPHLDWKSLVYDGICCLHFTSLRYIFTDKLQPHSSVLFWIDLRGRVADIMPEIIKRHFVEKVLLGPSGLEFFGMPKRIASPSAEIPPEFQTTGLQTTKIIIICSCENSEKIILLRGFQVLIGQNRISTYTGRGARCLQRAQGGIGELFAYSSKLSPLSHRTCSPADPLLGIQIGIPRVFA